VVSGCISTSSEHTNSAYTLSSHNGHHEKKSIEEAGDGELMLITEVAEPDGARASALAWTAEMGLGAQRRFSR
jgi:hypothetical protein